MTLEQVQTMRSLAFSPEDITAQTWAAQVAALQTLSKQSNGKTAPISYKDAVGDQGVDGGRQR